MSQERVWFSALHETDVISLYYRLIIIIFSNIEETLKKVAEWWGR